MSNYLLNKRTIFYLDNNNVDISRLILGFFIYFIIFVLFIPYYLIKTSNYELLSGYIPNLDLIACVIGYHGGPFNSFIWKHLYNPADSTLAGYISSNLINYFALLGVTYIIALYTFKFNDIEKGWSRAFIILLMTYFIPVNIIIYYMNMFGKNLNKYLNDYDISHYFIIVTFGLLMTIFFILLEAEIINFFGNALYKLIKKYKKILI